jgi:hypothetical protein
MPPRQQARQQVQAALLQMLLQPRRHQLPLHLQLGS